MAFREICTDQKLISLVEEFPNIYNKSDKTYKDENEKNKSWSSIASKMNIDVSIVKKRWHNLRDRFVRSYRNYTDTKSPSSDADKGIKFPLFFQMWWLAKFIRKRKLISYHNISNTNTKRLKPDSPNDPNRSNELYNNESSRTSEEEDPINIKVEYLTNNENGETSTELNSVGESSELPCKKVKHDTSHEVKCNKTESPILKMLDKMLSDGTDISDFNFMMSIVADMKNMNKKDKMKFKREVLDLFEKYID